MKLTLPQQDIYFEQLLYPNEPIYNIGAKIKIEGAIDIKVFQSAYKALIDQHDAYRTIFFEDQEGVSITIIEDQVIELEQVNFSNRQNPDEEANAFMQEMFIKPFDMLNGHLLHKFILIKVDDQLHYLFSVYHHIITDGWGTSLMFQRLVKNYNEILEFGKVTSEYPYSYSSFAADDEEYHHSAAFENDKAYWNEKFKSLPENLFERISYQDEKCRSSRKELILSRPFYNQLEAYAKKQGSSTFHLILATLYLYFGKKHQNKDFAIGLPVSNRSKAVFKKTVGLFMGVSPLRITLNFENNFQDLISSIKNQLRSDYRHQRFPLGKLIQELQLFHEKQKLFNITLSYEKQNYSDDFSGTRASVIPLTHQAERVALAIYIREFDEQENVKIDFDYNLNFFDVESISQIAAHFENLLHDVIQYPDKKLKEFNYLSEKEEEQLIYGFNSTKTLYPSDKTFLDIFKEQCKLTPKNNAVFDKERKLSYDELDQLSDKISSFLLQNNKTNRNTNVIGVALERSVFTIAILLGIMKAGKAYIPLDPTFPAERLNYIIKHSGLETLISDQQDFHPEVPGLQVLTVDKLIEESNSIKGEGIVQAKFTDTAYIIYTSGSTGNPKGVEIGHRSLLNFLLSIKKEPGIQDRDCLFAVTTYSFDISILEFFAPLICGASVYIADHATLDDPQRIIKAIEQVRPSIIQATPSFYQLLFNAGWKGRENLKVLCGGDLLSEDLAENILKSGAYLWNMYGPTETTIWSSVKHITSMKEASNIGKPIANTQFYILDEFMQPVPVGIAGNLYIAGDGLARGYFKDEELTKQKFMKNPFEENTLAYNTSDLAKWNNKGEVEFLGRNDNQVKIRGYRVELGDIETKINLIPEIKEAVVVARKHAAQEAFLVAYVIKEKETCTTQEIISFLQKELPDYMIPYTIIPIESFPLTPNKKIDRKALINQDIVPHREEGTFKPAESTLQKKLVELWKEVLRLEKPIGILDNFFTLGGHSLNAVKLTHQINNQLFYEISLKAIFNYPTIESLANHLHQTGAYGRKKIPPAAVKNYYQLTPAQYEIWLASQNRNRSIAYNMVAAFKVEGEIQADRISKVINQMILENEILRTNFIEMNGKAFQQINAAHLCNFNVPVDWVEENELGPALSNYIQEEFDLEKELLIKMKILKTSENSSFLIFCTHHIIMDGGSLEHFVKTFLNYYKEASVTGSISDTTYSKPKLQFKDYSEWLISSSNSTGSPDFWKNYLADYKFKESIAPDWDVKSNTYAGSYLQFQFDVQDTGALKTCVQIQATTLHNFLVAALTGLIYKLSGNTDICLGTVNSGRTTPQLDDAIGMFVKTLPLRTSISSEQTFFDLLHVVQKNVLAIHDHQELPEVLSQKNLFDMLVVFQNPDFSYQDSFELNGSELEQYPIDVHFSRVPLLFNFYESGNQLYAVINYSSEKYEEETIQFFLLRFKQLIKSVTANAYLQIEEIDMYLPFEKKATIEFNF